MVACQPVGVEGRPTLTRSINLPWGCQDAQTAMHHAHMTALQEVLAKFLPKTLLIAKAIIL